MRTFRISIGQINPVVGDIAGNAAKILRFHREACRAGRPDLVVFPECALVGYPPEDLLLRASFVRAAARAASGLASRLKGAAAVFGCVREERGQTYNAAAFADGRGNLSFYSKQFLPNYGVFDEKRYFAPGNDSGLFRVNGVRIGVSVCEDIWFERSVRLIDDRPVPTRSPWLTQAKAGAQVLINISASPFHAGKFRVRHDLLKGWTRRTRLPVVYANLVGGQDQLVFDGRSVAMDARGRLLCVGRSFGEDLCGVEIDLGRGAASGKVRPEWPEEGIDEIYDALVLGTRDYVEKNGFPGAIIGLSGGIDSALTACIAADALGPERVQGVTLPSRYSSAGTRSDAERVAKNLGIRFLKIPIEGVFSGFLKALKPVFRGRGPDTTEENLQSRIRGVTLMALSNKFGSLVLTTGNKSEMSVGYCTLYGDTAGGFAVLKDVPKTVVYRLSRLVNARAGKPVIPLSTIRRAPSAELRRRQKDQDTLPPYPLLDRIIKGYVEEDRGYGELVRSGLPASTVKRVLGMIDRSEYKRVQSPPGVKITPKAFGKDRRMPVTNRFFEEKA